MMLETGWFSVPSIGRCRRDAQGIAGNIGFVMFTCIGDDPRDFVRDACSFMKAKNPKLADDSDILRPRVHFEMSSR